MDLLWHTNSFDQLYLPKYLILSIIRAEFLCVLHDFRRIKNLLTGWAILRLDLEHGLYDSSKIL